MVTLSELRDPGRHVNPRGLSRPLRPGPVRAAGRNADPTTLLDLQHWRGLCPLRRRDDAGGRLLYGPEAAAVPAPRGAVARLPIPGRARVTLPGDDDAGRHS